MPKTIKEIADELGVEKQKVYRYIKQHRISEVHHEALHDAHQRSGAKYYDEAAETLIKQGFFSQTASSEAHHEVHHEAHQNRINEAVNEAVIDMLRQELEIKNEQIRELNARLAEVSSALVAAQQTSQSLAAGHAAEKQRELADKLIEGQQLISGDAAEEPEEAPTEERRGWLHRLFSR